MIGKVKTLKTGLILILSEKNKTIGNIYTEN